MEEIKIGNQIWMKSNLDVETFKNGDVIIQATSITHWNELRENKTPAWCYYQYDFENYKKFGKFYNKFALSDPRGLAPEGWHIPSDEEWNLLAETLGGQNIAADKLKALNTWEGYEETDDDDNPTGVFISDNANNLSGFSALPSGFCHHHGQFFDKDNACYFWTSDLDDNNHPVFRAIYCGYSDLAKDNENSVYAASIRCVRDN